MDWLDVEGGNAVMFLIGLVSSIFLAGILFVFYISTGLGRGNQALVLATAISSLGTFLLALGTFYNIFQTNRRLQMEEKDREKALVLEELSYLIQPSIEALESNLESFNESDENGCVFEWVYIDGSSLYSGSRGPEKVRYRQSSVSAGRMASEDSDLHIALQKQEACVHKLSMMASDLHEKLEPKIQQLFAEDSVEGESTKAVTSAVLKDLDEWGENEVMKDFWSRHGSDLMDHAKTETSVTVYDIWSLENHYHGHMVETYRDLKDRKDQLKTEYRISEDEIAIGNAGSDLFE